MYQPFVDSSSHANKQPWENPTIRNQSQLMYFRSVARGRFRRLLGKLKRNPNLLEDLRCIANEKVQSRYYGGMETVPIEEIKGTEGRVDDFDDAFNPLHERNRSRWLKIAALRLDGDTLPPVELVHVDDTYYVRDGHHRISVAQALGEEFIDAEVIHWDQHKISEAKRISVYAPRTRLTGQQF